MSIESRVNKLEHRDRSRANRASGTRPAHICEFATDPRFLNLQLYPIQLLVLKVITLAVELLTDADRRRLADWMAGYQLIDDRGTSRFDGASGTPPDLMERISFLRASGRQWFRNVVLIAGRRSGKSFLASILMAWTLWKLLEHDDPQSHLRLPPGKQINWLLFSTTREAAARDVFADLVDRLTNSPCFAEFLEPSTANTVRLYTRTQLRSGARERGERGSIVITAAPTVATAARGAAVFGFVFDEIAYLDSSASATGTEIIRAARPASAQFLDAIAVFASTPSSQAGAFFEEFRRATIADATGTAMLPDRLVVHLSTRAMSEGWQDAGGQPMWPDGPAYGVFDGPLVPEEELAKEQAADGEMFANEYEAIWRAIKDAYFSDTTVARLFSPFQGRKLTTATHGRGDMRYVAHGDPAVSSDNFGFVIGHTETHDGQDHVMIDLIHYWAPSDFDEGEVQLGTVENEIADYAAKFRLDELYFDQLNSAQMIQTLQVRLKQEGWGTQVGRKQATTKTKLERYELTKRMINEGRVHCPEHQLLYDEMRFLQRKDLTIGAPSGKSDDLIDAVSYVVTHLVAAENTVGHALGSLRPVGTDLDIINRFRDAVPSQRNPPSNPARPTRNPYRR